MAAPFFMRAAIAPIPFVWTLASGNAGYQSANQTMALKLLSVFRSATE
jgi:hypothetical protein